MSDSICQILHGLDVGGAEVLAAALARRLRDRFRFVFLCLDQMGTLGRELADEGHAVHVLGRRGGVDWRCIRRLAGLLCRERVDVLHAHQYTPFFYGAAGRLLGPRRPPLLFTEHGRHQPDYPRLKRMVANRFLLRAGDRVVGVGEAVRAALIRNEGLPAGRVEVIHNGVPLDRFEVPSGERDAARAELGMAPATPVLIQVARLDHLKDHVTAMHTLARVARERPDVRLLLVGDGPERPAIEALVSRLRLETHVRLLGQWADVPRLLAASDLVLLTSISEGVPLTLIEAMAAGLPVVATRVGGVDEVVVDGRTGLLAPAGDAGALAERVLRLASDAAERERMGRLGRERAREMFSEARMHARHLRVYEDLLRPSETRATDAIREEDSRTPTPAAPGPLPPFTPANRT